MVTYSLPKIVTVTELMTYKRCRLLWHLSFQRKLRPNKESAHFYVGRLTHRTLELWKQGVEEEASFVQALTEETDRLKARYLEQVGAHISQVEIDEKLEQSHLPMAMLANYAAYWKTPLPEGYELIQPEQTCLVDIPNTWHWRCDTCNYVAPIVTEVEREIGQINCGHCNQGVQTAMLMQLEGTLDGFVMDSLTYKIYVLERKTYEKRPQASILNSAEQFTMYCWILSQLFPDADIGGVLYDGLWKRETPPRGRTMEDLFYRDLLIKTPEEIQQEGEYVIAAANEILNSPAIYPNRVWQGCFDDRDFDHLCAAIMKQQDDVDFIIDSDYTTRDTRWFEAEEDDE